MPPNFLDLLNHTCRAKMLSGLVWMWRSDAPTAAQLLTAHGDCDDNGEMLARTEPRSAEPYFVDAAGTGFLLIHREVVKAVGPEPFGNNKSESEDLDFCRKANAYGYKVLIVPEVNPNHVKLLSFNDIYAYSRAVARLAVNGVAAKEESSAPALTAR